MTAMDHPKRRSQRLRKLTIALFLALTPILSACTPEQVEMSVNQLAVSFEQGGVERDLVGAVFVARMAIPEIGMRLGSAFGP